MNDETAIQPIDAHKKNACAQRYKEQYQGWIGKLLSRAPTLHDNEQKRDLITCLEHLKVLGAQMWARL